MSKLLRMLFRKYEPDSEGSYIHHGVGYVGIDYEMYPYNTGAEIHHGVGYGGMK